LFEVGEFGVFGVQALTQGFQFGLEPLDPGEPRIRLLAGLLGCVPLLVELGLQVRVEASGSSPPSAAGHQHLRSRDHRR
jgi:hypothetical protein